MLVDDLALGYDEVPRKPARPAWALGAAPAKGGLTLGVSGSF
jgi:hypothetical protein